MAEYFNLSDVPQELVDAYVAEMRSKIPEPHPVPMDAASILMWCFSLKRYVEGD